MDEYRAEYYDELLAFRKKSQLAWEEKERQRVPQRCAELGVTPAPLCYIECLEGRVNALYDQTR